VDNLWITGHQLTWTKDFGKVTAWHLVPKGKKMEDKYSHILPWNRPRNYVGASWDGYYAAPVGQSRDSDTVERSNWEAQIERIPESDTVIIVRESHWAVGWVEWLAIHESDTMALAEAEAIGEELEEYPILDEDRWSELELEESDWAEEEEEDEDWEEDEDE
jgi:hypothetical protein